MGVCSLACCSIHSLALGQVEVATLVPIRAASGAPEVALFHTRSGAGPLRLGSGGGGDGGGGVGLMREKRV